MKPINSKERSKQLWQFVFIFFALAFVPLALIFFSYYKVPDEISKSEEDKLVQYSSFEQTKKQIFKKMSEVDSNINLYATATTENPVLMERKISDGLSDLGRMDTSNEIVRQLHTGYENHFTHVRQLVQEKGKNKDALMKLQDAEKRAASSSQMPVMNGGAAPMPLPPGQ